MTDLPGIEGQEAPGFGETGLSDFEPVVPALEESWPLRDRHAGAVLICGP